MDHPLHLSPEASPGGTSANHAANKLSEALDKLRQIDLILEQLSVFWANTEVVLDVLTKKGQHMEQFVGFSNKPRLMARFRERMEEYKRFWEGINIMCSNYVQGINQHAGSATSHNNSNNNTSNANHNNNSNKNSTNHEADHASSSTSTSSGSFMRDSGTNKSGSERTGSHNGSATSSKDTDRSLDIGGSGSGSGRGSGSGIGSGSGSGSGSGVLSSSDRFDSMDIDYTAPTTPTGPSRTNSATRSPAPHTPYNEATRSSSSAHKDYASNSNNKPQLYDFLDRENSSDALPPPRKWSDLSDQMLAMSGVGGTGIGTGTGIGIGAEAESIYPPPGGSPAVNAAGKGRLPLSPIVEENR